MPDQKNKKNSINAHVEEALRNHIESAMPFNQAIMIDGKWGSGKTHFATSFIKENSSTKIHLISLFGLKKTSDITATIIRECIPQLKSKPASIGLFLLKAATRGTISLDSEAISFSGSLEGFENAINYKAASLSKTAFFFDDLERCEINIVELLGFLNQLIEKENHKVVLLTDEEQLKRKWKSETAASYSEMKEKIIRRTLTLHPDFETVFHSIKGHLNHPLLLKHIDSLFRPVKNVFDTSECQNFRILQNILFDFEKIYSLLPNAAQTHPNFLSHFCKLYCIFSIENHLCTLTRENFEDNINEYYPPATLSVLKETNTKGLEKYRIYDDLKILFSKETWTAIIFGQFPSTAKLEKELDNIYYFEQDYAPAWRVLKDPLSLENKQFDSKKNELVSRLKKNEITCSEELLYTVSNLLWLHHKSLISSPPRMDIIRWGHNALEQVPKEKNPTRTLEILREPRVFLAYDISEFRDFTSIVESHLFTEDICTNIEIFRQLLKNDHRLLIDKIRNNQIQFNLIPQDEFASFLISTTNHVIRSFTLQIIHFSSEYGQILYELKIRIEKKLNEVIHPLQKALLNKLCKTIEKHHEPSKSGVPAVEPLFSISQLKKALKSSSTCSNTLSN